jgi:uncharacterized protein YggU (UPF0235/DUF167 family)
MIFVPTVMLNALIAIMSDTFERVQQHMIAAGRLERAKIILVRTINSESILDVLDTDHDRVY